MITLLIFNARPPTFDQVGQRDGIEFVKHGLGSLLPDEASGTTGGALANIGLPYAIRQLGAFFQETDDFTHGNLFRRFGQ
jgi:hypothetical protein